MWPPMSTHPTQPALAQARTYRSSTSARGSGRLSSGRLSLQEMGCEISVSRLNTQELFHLRSDPDEPPRPRVHVNVLLVDIHCWVLSARTALLLSAKSTQMLQIASDTAFAAKPSRHSHQIPGHACMGGALEVLLAATTGECCNSESRTEDWKLLR